jgi:tetratricopeptide (TPR) repeat protein
MKVSLPKINSDRIKALTQKLMQDKHEKILEDLVDLERDNPEDMRVKQKIAELLYKQTNIEPSIDKFKEIAAYYEKNDFILKAIRACQQILKIKPLLVEYNIKLGSLHLKLGMTNEAANQYRITVNHFAHVGDVENTLKYSQILVKVDPSTDNKVKLAEIYQNSNMTNEAVSIYNELAQEAREKKQYDKLLHFYEMLLPHTPNSSTLLRDVCILSLRKQRPDHVLRLLDQYQAMDNRAFEDLVKKARLMREALRRQKK